MRPACEHSHPRCAACEAEAVGRPRCRCGFWRRLFHGARYGPDTTTDPWLPRCGYCKLPRD